MKTPITAQIEITEKCNLKCPHCYLLEGKEVNGENEDDAKILKIVDRLIALKLFNVVITGGEPLLKKEILLKCSNKLIKNNISVSINTNLQALTPDFLDHMNLKELRNFLVSCPSSNPETYRAMTGGGKYSLFLKNLKLLLSRTDKVFINMVINKLNIKEIRKTAQDLKKVGIKRFGATPMAINLLNIRKDYFLSIPEVQKVVDDLIWVHESLGMDVDILEPLPKCIFSDNLLNQQFAFLKKKCSAAITSFSVSPNGNVRPCGHNIDSYGNIIEEKFSDIWEKMKEWRSGSYIPNECKDCRALHFCAGGCRITAKGINGSLNSKDPWMIKPFAYNPKNYSNESIKTTLTQDTIIKFVGELQFRKEKNDDSYLVAIKHKANTVRVNPELFRAILYLSDIKEITALEFAQDKRVLNSVEYKNIINFLKENKFVLLTNT